MNIRVEVRLVFELHDPKKTSIWSHEALTCLMKALGCFIMALKGFTEVTHILMKASISAYMKP